MLCAVAWASSRQQNIAAVDVLTVLLAAPLVIPAFAKGPVLVLLCRLGLLSSSTGVTPTEKLRPAPICLASSTTLARHCSSRSFIQSTVAWESVA